MADLKLSNQDNLSVPGRSDEALRETEQRYRLIVETCQAGVWVVDADSRTTYVNRRMMELLGYTAEEMVGRSLFDYIEGSMRETVSARFEERKTGARGQYDVILIRKDGAGIWASLSASPILGPQGEFQGSFGIIADMSERKRTEEELRESEGRYRRLYNETPVMLHSIDQHGCLISVSNYWLETLGYERSEVIGRKSTEFMTESSRRYAEQVVLPNFFATGSCKDIPYQFVKKSGEEVEVLLSAIAERDENGAIIRSLAVMTDVTERRRFEEQIETLNTDLAARAYELESANQELEAFNYTVSHDLRAPLTNIYSSSQALLELYGGQLDETAFRLVRTVYNEVERMERLISTLLDFARLAQAEPARHMVDLSALAEEILAELRLSEPARRVRICIAGGITALGDVPLLRVGLVNLLGNAWKYTGLEELAIIEFGVAAVRGELACFVRDNGAGFDMENADLLFRPFKRLPGAKGFKGAGIGLATVQRIIHRHGGSLWAESAPGEGATFYFTLPGLQVQT